MSEHLTSKEWATRARFEKIKAEMPEGIPGYSEFRFDWMHDALRELIDYCDALHAVEPETVRTTDATLNAGLDQLRAIANGQVLKISPLQARLILDYVSHAEPSDTDHCHADPIHCTPECRLKTCDHAWDFNYVPPQCAFGCGATLEALDAPAVTKDAAQPMHGGALVAPGRCDNGECWCHGGISVETREGQS